MIILKGILILLIMLVVPLMLGDIITYWTKTEQRFYIDNMVLKLVVGYIVMWAVFQFIAVPLIIIKYTFNSAFLLWSIIIAILLICDIVKIIKKDKTKSYTNLKVYFNKIPVYIILVTVVILYIFQSYHYVKYMHIDDDDARFIVNSVEAYDNNIMLLNNPCTGEYEGTWIGELAKDVTSPWTIYIAVISKIVSIFPTIVAHTILPPFLLLICYGAYYLLGRKLFGEKDIESALLFVFAVQVINLFFNTSLYTQSSFLLTRIWQGKAVVAGVAIPIIFYVLYSLYKEECTWGRIVLVGMVNMAMCLLSGIGITVGAIMTLIYGGWYIFMKKDWKKLMGLVITVIPNVLYAVLYVLIK